MKKYIKIIGLIGVLLLTLVVSGCGAKKALTVDDFKTKMETLGFEIMDQTEYISNEDISKAYIAQKVGAYQVEYYLAKSEAGATAGYDQYIANLKLVAGTDTKSNSEEKAKTYSKYTDSAGDYYSVVVKIDKTYLYVRAAEKYKSEINTILKELGY